MTMVIAMAIKSSIIVKPGWEWFGEQCIDGLLLKPREVTGNGEIADALLRRGHLYGHGYLPDVGTNVAGDIEQRFNENLTLEIVQGNDLVIRGSYDAIGSREYLAVQDGRLSSRSHDAVRAREE